MAEVQRYDRAKFMEFDACQILHRPRVDNNDLRLPGRYSPYYKDGWPSHGLPYMNNMLVTRVHVLLILVCLGDFGQTPGPSSVLFWEGAGAFLCIRYRGKLRQHTLIRVQCTKKSTRVPVSPVPSTGIRFKKVKIIKTYNPYTKILKFVLLIWEERNSGRYEHARACRERVHAPRASEKTHQPSNDIITPKG
jgi:hypothetical protein